MDILEEKDQWRIVAAIMASVKTGEMTSMEILSEFEDNFIGAYEEFQSYAWPVPSPEVLSVAGRFVGYPLELRLIKMGRVVEVVATTLFKWRILEALIKDAEENPMVEMTFTIVGQMPSEALEVSGYSRNIDWFMEFVENPLLVDVQVKNV